MVAEAVAVSLIGWFVTPFVTKSINAALEYAKETNKSFKKVSTNLQKLADNLGVIKKTVHKVQLCFIKKGEGEEILWGLKGAIDEAEKILDLFEYESLKNKRLKNKRISSKFALQFTGTKDSPSQLEEVVEKLGRLGQSAQDFLQNSKNIIHDSPIFHGGRETGPSPPNVFFFGYDKEHRKLKGLLKGEQNKVIAIIGHGGMGKTHLARQVFHAKESKFDVRIWAHVCNKTGQIDLLTEICKSAINKSGSLILRAPMDSLNVTALQSKVEGLLKPSGWFENSCLVVLDDVWQHEDGSGISRTQRDEAWTRVLAMFKSLKNCKVVMTTRDKVCSTTLKADETIVLDGISIESMSKLLKYYIAKLPHQVLPQDLADRIAGKLKGSPRAALSIVDKLKTASETQKKIILDELEDDHHIERLYEDHLFTYRHLPPRLQSCLAFCSMFPYDWRFEPEKLSKMWVAHGFIDDTHQKLTIQDVAEGYFEDLVDRSLFKKGKDGRYEIHVHIHSMLRKVSRNECLSISNGSSSSEITVPATVRHLSVTASCLAKLKPAGPSLEKAKEVQAWINKKKSDDEFRTVRTLLVLRDKQCTTSDDIHIREANSTLRKFKGVKVLDLTDTGITQLPDSVGELTHLRYLGYPNTVKQPPADEITKLLLLETLYVSNSQSPAADMDMEGIAKIGGIGKLEKLQGSVEFHVHRRKDKKGRPTMSELGKMNSLGRTLSIKGIRTVATKEEAQEAHLEMKASLQVLKLDWELNQNKNSNADGGKGKGKGNGGAATDDLGVLEGLQPHANLRELHITRYPGEKLPTWMWDVDRMKNLTSLYLTRCNCTELKSSVDCCLKEKFPRLKIVIDNVEILVASGAGESTDLKPKNRLKKKNDDATSSSESSTATGEPSVPLQGSAPKPPRTVGMKPPGPAPKMPKPPTFHRPGPASEPTTNPPPLRPSGPTPKPTTKPPAGIIDVLVPFICMFVFSHPGIKVVFLVLFLRKLS